MNNIKEALQRQDAKALKVEAHGLKGRVPGDGRQIDSGGGGFALSPRRLTTTWPARKKNL